MVSEDTLIYIVGSGWVNYNQVTPGKRFIGLNTSLDSWDTFEVKEVTSCRINSNCISQVSEHFDTLFTTCSRVPYIQQYSGNTVLKSLEKLRGSTNNLTSSHSLSKVDLGEDYIRLAAWCCTDSYFDGDVIILYQRVSRHEVIQNLLEKLEIPFTRTVRNRDIKQICGRTLLKRCESSVEFRIPVMISRRLSDHLRVFSNKGLPKWSLNCSDNQFDTFLKELVMADGHKRDKTPTETCQVFYGELPICEDVQLACHLHGWRAFITEYRPGQYRVNICQRVSSSCKPRLVEASGLFWKLYDVDRPILVKRQGKIHWVCG